MCIRDRDKTIQVIEKASPKQKIFLVCKTPQDALRLVEGGVKITEINIGNMHFSEGKQQISSTVSLDEDDKKTLRKLHELGVKIEQRRVPDERVEVDLLKYI